MNRQSLFTLAWLSAALACSIWLSPCCMAQGSSPSVSVVTLRTTTGQNGQQMVITPSNQSLPLPGAGVNGSSVNIFIGSQGGYWYVDKNGQNFDLTPYVQNMTVSMNGNNSSAYTNSSNSSGSSGNSNSNSSSGSSNGETAAAAGLGAMVGAAATNAYSDYNNQYQVPYGVAVVGGGGNPYYTGADGKNVYVNNSQSANVNAYGGSLASQEKWYAQQQAANTQKFQEWQKNAPSKNPFVANGTNPSDAAGGRHHGGPFGGRGPSEAGAPSGGPFAGGGPFGGHGGAPSSMPSGGASGGPSGGPFAGGGGPFAGRGGAPSSMPSGGPSGMPSGGPFGGRMPSGGPPAGGGGMPMMRGGMPGPGPR